MVFTRGRADVSLLQHLLSSKGDVIWTDEVRAQKFSCVVVFCPEVPCSSTPELLEAFL